MNGSESQGAELLNKLIYHDVLHKFKSEGKKVISQHLLNQNFYSWKKPGSNKNGYIVLAKLKKKVSV